MKKGKILTFVLLCLICFGLGASWTILPSISNSILNSQLYGITSEDYAILNVLLVLGALLGANGAGEISRFSGTKKTLVLGLCFMSMGLLILGLTEVAASERISSFSFLALSQFLLGVGIGMILTSTGAFIALYLEHLSAVGITGAFACVNIGSSFCPFILDQIKTVSHWWYFPIFTSVFFLMLIGISMAALPIVINRSTQGKMALMSIFCNISWRFWIFPFIIFLYAMVEIAFTSWGVILLHNAKSVSVLQANYALSIYWIVVAVSQLIICGLVSFIPFRRIYIVLPVILLVSIFSLLFTLSPLISVLAFIFAGLGNSAFFSLTIHFGELEFKQVAELIASSIVTGYFLGGGVGSLIIGYASKAYSFKSAYSIIAAIGVLLSFLVILMIITSRKSRTTS